MPVDSEFGKTERVAETTCFTLLRVVHKQTGDTYLLKQFKEALPNRIQYLKSILDLSKTQNWDGVLTPIKTKEIRNLDSILLKDFDGISLRNFIERRITRRSNFHLIASSIVKAVSSLHNTGWILRNICPEHLLINPKTFACKIVDLQKLTTLKVRKLEKIDEDDKLINYLYLSPEQTGYNHHIVDARADYYAMGIIFYELLTGKHPFPFTEPSRLVQAHLTIVPNLPGYIDSFVPQIFNDVVQKLLAKLPDERYQSEKGLLYDLNQITFHVDGASHNNTFVPGAHDEINRINFSGNLIGRKKELKKLYECQELSVKGKKQILYISGGSGVGKSRLVREFTLSRSIFKETIVSAKFDILQRNTPYSAFLTAIKELINRLLKENEVHLHFWRERILNSLRGNGRIITDVISELSTLIGAQPEVPPLPPEESLKRFNQTFLGFISCFTSESHALTIFLDDLQWADIASVRLIELIVSDHSIKNLFFIGSYRDREVDPTSPLALSIKKQEEWIDVKEISLEPMQKEHTRELILQSLYRPLANTEAFVDSVHNKTKGNIFFTIQLLSSLFEDKALYFDDNYTWQWTTDAFSSERLGKDVLDLLRKKISGFNEPMRTIIISSGSLGDIFDLKTIAAVCNLRLDLAAKNLAQAVNAGFVIPLDENLDKFINTPSSPDERDLAVFNNALFRFAHDRIRGVAFSLLNKNESAAINLKAARYKIRNYSLAQINDALFYLANHYNEGEMLISSTDEISQLVQINFQAGMKAKNASAYDAAVKYFSSGAKHLNFQDNYQQLQDFYREMAVSKFLSGQFTEAETDIEFALKNATTKLDKLELLFPKVYLCIVRDQKEKAIAVAREGYRLFEVTMPKSDIGIKVALLRDIILSRLILNEKSIDHLIEKPLMTDKENIRFLEFTLAVAPAIYQTNQNLFAWNVMRMLFRTLTYGTSGIASFGYLGYGMIVSQLFRNYKLGKRFAHLALELNNHFGFTAQKWKILLSYYNFVHHWTEPVRSDLEKILEIENAAFANGDPIFAGYAIFIYHQKKFALGFNLELLQQSFEKYLRLVDQRSDTESRNFLLGYYQTIRCLLGLEENIKLLGEDYNVYEKIEEAVNSSSFSIAADIYIAHITTLVIFNEFDDALAQYFRGARYMEFIQQRYEFEESNFYGALICASAVEKGVGNKTILLKNLKKHLKLLTMWKNNCHENFETQWLLVNAEREKCLGNDTKSVSLYDKAIRKAEESLCIHYKAIGCERAARFHLKLGNFLIAKTYLENGIESYFIWGAMEKVKRLKNEFSDLLGESLKNNREYEFSNQTLIARNLNSIFDTDLVKSPSDLDKILEKLIRLIVKYLIADTACLMLNLKSNLVIKAVYSPQDDVRIVTEYPEGDRLPLSLIKHVVKGKQAVIITNPCTTPEYSSLSYFQRKKPLSVLTYPIVRQNEIFGILYLENYSTDDVFDYQRLDILNIISTQLTVVLGYHEKFYNVFEEKEQLKSKYEKALLQSQLEIQEQAFNKVSQEIHDNIGQVLSLVRLNLKTLDSGINVEKLAATDSLLGRAISDLRNLSHELNNDYIKKAGISVAITELLNNLKKTGKYNTEFHDEIDLDRMNSEKSIILYRIIQEIVNNILKHADATEISISTQRKDLTTQLVIKDNGKGFDTTSLSNGMGIMSMTERASFIEAGLSIESDPGCGTTVIISFDTI